ncbi:MAG TPA: alpha/beta hydrolase [Streptosporangiaceae bacterium]|nr:alpha/beta hydrolase [Streptosporangiaceae bacterium]
MPVLARPAGDIYYQVTGSSGPPLLLTHGYGATSAMFAGNLAALAVGHRVITWDLRGHGRSEYPADRAAYSAANALADMAALLAELGPDRAVLGGHSLGGFLSLDFALTFPERVAALVLIGTGPGYRNDAARDDWNRRAHVTAARLAARGLAGLAGSAELHSDEHRDATGLIHAATQTLTQRDARVIDGLPRIAAPTLVIVGADDTPFLGAADYMAGKIPGARKVVIPGAGHAPNVSQPEAFNRAVTRFLAELSALGEPRAATPEARS